MALIVELLVANPDRRYTLSQIVDEVGLSISTAHSILTTLTARGWVIRHRSDKAYTLGPRLAAVGRAGRGAMWGLADVEQAVDHLSATLDLVCSASALQGDEIVIVAQARPIRVEDPATRVGQRIPSGAPFGAGFVAWRSRPEIEAWLARSPLGISPTERELYDRVLAGIRERGYGVERFDTARTKLHEALVEFRDQTMSSGLIERIREFLPLVSVREFLPEELAAAGHFDVAMVHAPVLDGEGEARFNLSAHLRRHGVAAAELDKVASMVLEAAQRCSDRLRAP